MENVPGFQTQYEGSSLKNFYLTLKILHSVYHSLISASNNGIPQNSKGYLLLALEMEKDFNFLLDRKI